MAAILTVQEHDLFSLAVTTWEILTGIPPPDDGSLPDLRLLPDLVHPSLVMAIESALAIVSF